MLKAKGLYTFSNYLSSIPEGALLEADNVIIDRDGVIEPRRGFETHAEFDITAGDPEKIEQLIAYDGTIFASNKNGKFYDINGSALHDDNHRFYDIYNVTDTSRLKSVQQNGNLYLTTKKGIYKLENKSSTPARAGVPQALDVELSLDLSKTTGFLLSSNDLDTVSSLSNKPREVSYRIVFGIKDSNDNLILGAPSYKSTISNYTDTSRDVIVKTTIPEGLSLNHFYQIYRTSGASLVGGSGDEMKLVAENALTSTNGTIEYLDNQPVSLQETGTPLYTNQYNGEGIAQANAEPPRASDIAAYKNVTFYSNVKTKQKLELTLTGLDNLRAFVDAYKYPTETNIYCSAYTTTSFTFSKPLYSLVSTGDNIVVTDGTQYHYFENITVSGNTITVTGTFTSTRNSQELSFYKGRITYTTAEPTPSYSKDYYFVGRSAELSLITGDGATGFVGSSLVSSNVGKYFNITSAQDANNVAKEYMVWFSKNSLTQSPVIPSGKIGLKVSYISINNDLGSVRCATTEPIDLTGTTPIDGINLISGDKILVKDQIDTVDNGFYNSIIIDAQANPTTNKIERSYPHNFVSGDRVKLSSNSTPPSGLSLNKLYYVVNPTTYDFQLSETSGGSAVDIVSTGYVTVTGLTRSFDMYALGTVYNEDYAYVTEGTVNAGKGFVISSNYDSIHISVMPMPWVETDIPDTYITLASKISAALNTTFDFYCSNLDSSFLETNTVKILTSKSGNASLTDGNTGWTSAFVEDIKGIGNFGTVDSINLVALSQNQSPSLAIEETAKNLARSININENYLNVFYQSSDSTLPGNLFLEETHISTENYPGFYIKVPTQSVGLMFSPNIPTGTGLQSTSEDQKNALYFSKTQQPEAVPKANKLTVGSKNKAIMRIVALRDSLFIFKEDGLYRLTGTDINSIQIVLFDETANLIAVDSLGVLNNLIYGLVNDGVVTISETGVGIISRPIENIFDKLKGPEYSSDAVKKNMYAVAYQPDRAFILFVPQSENDEYSTRAYRYNIFTQTWTSWTLNSTCAVVDPIESKLYLGTVNSIEIERKSRTANDYAEKEYDRYIVTHSNGNFILSDLQNLKVGDVIIQPHEVSILSWNRLIDKLMVSSIDTTIINEDLPDLLIKEQDNLVFLDHMQRLFTGFQTGNRLYKLFTSKNASYMTGIMTKLHISNHGYSTGDSIAISGSYSVIPVIFSTFGTSNYAFVKKIDNNTIELCPTYDAAMAGTSETFTLGSYSGLKTLHMPVAMINSSDSILASFNRLVDALNTSLLIDKTYRYATTDIVMAPIISIDRNSVRLLNSPIFFIGDCVSVSAIPTKITWAPIAFGEQSMAKHVSHGIVLTENMSLAGSSLAFATDLSGNFEKIDFLFDGSGNFGESMYGEAAWGGEGYSVPVRTLIPKQKQRCRFIKTQFTHRYAFYKFSILGIAFTYNITSERAWF
jgi:hypothetical protein